MTTKRKRQIEIFSAGCRMCEETIKLAQSLICGSSRSGT